MKRFIFYHAGRILRAVGFNSREGEDPRVREMQQRVRDLGGIQFQFELHPDGSWTAESVNIEGILTGSRDPREAGTLMRDAVFTYFGIPPYLCNDSLLKMESETVAARQRVYATT